MDPRVRPTVFTYNTVMSQLARRGRVAEALELREEMQQRGLQPDTVTLNILLGGMLAADPPQTAEAEALFQSMLTQGPPPDQYTFSILLKAFSRAAQREEEADGAEPERLLEMIVGARARDLDLDTTAVNTFIQALFMGGATRKALELFEAFRAGEGKGAPGLFGLSGRTFYWAWRLNVFDMSLTLKTVMSCAWTGRD
jgi:pentatricopeptide repeat protein